MEDEVRAALDQLRHQAKVLLAFSDEEEVREGLVMFRMAMKETLNLVPFKYGVIVLLLLIATNMALVYMKDKQ